MAATTQRPADTVPAIALLAIRRAESRAKAGRKVLAAKNAPAIGATYTVAPGDTLSSIADHFYDSPAYWPVLYWANHGQIRYANDIQAGQVLTIPVKPARLPAAPSVLSPAAATAGTSAASASTAQDAPASTAQDAPAQDAPADNPADNAGTPAGSDSGFQQCVISRESGGNSQAWGPGGYYGLYQFSASTWAEYGGDPADFGSATAAEQNQVFDNAIAAGGESNWSAYDGC